MPAVVGVVFREAGRIHYFDADPHVLNRGDLVVAETTRGIELGQVKLAAEDVPPTVAAQAVGPIVRLATADDCARARANTAREREALNICASKVRKHNLPMKLLRAEYTLDRARIVFFFAAEGRVDFRELVKDLASSLRTRIELHQVGSRDAAKLMGGFGRCGREICCGGWLPGFEPVSIKMAKDQDLALNPAKFSGQCGKLMCCLRYEVDFYREARQGLPKVGATLSLADGEAKVVEVNVPRGMVTVEYQETAVRQSFPAEALRKPAPEACCSPCAQGCAGRAARK